MKYQAILDFLKMEEERRAARGVDMGPVRAARETLRLALDIRFPRLSRLIAVENMDADQAMALFRVAVTATTERDVLEGLLEPVLPV